MSQAAQAFQWPQPAILEFFKLLKHVACLLVHQSVELTRNKVMEALLKKLVLVRNIKMLFDIIQTFLEKFQIKK